MKITPNWIMIVLGIILAFGCAWAVWIIYNDSRVTPNDAVGLWVLASICGVFSLIAIVGELFGGRILKAMYGDFSNRNPWGR